MKYIVFDLEWNQCPEGKGREDARLPFEIIEIGAWKLDESREIIDQFHVIIKPQVYKWIHSRTREVIHVDYKSLVHGIPFPEAVSQFLTWCGEDCRFCTWGDLDLMELQRNMKYYHMEELLKGPIFYYDVQKLFSLSCEDGKSRKSLEYGIDSLGLPKNDEFHRALEDAKYTAAIFRKLDMEELLHYYSVDVYQNPKSKKEELHIYYPLYEKYISREFVSKEAAMKDREVCSTRCPHCRKPARRKIRWFSANTRHYYSLSWCEEHGFVKGKIRMKKAENGNCYVVKTIKSVDAQEAENIRKKQEFIQAKRKQKRRQLQQAKRNL